MAISNPVPMKKSELLSALSQSTGLTKKQVSELLDALAELSYEETKKNGVFAIPGIGKLVLRKRPSRKGRNPKTGEEIQIPAKTVVKFVLSKNCKEAITPSKNNKK